MKFFTTGLLHFLSHRASRRDISVLFKFMATLIAMVSVYSIVFHYLMAREGQDSYSWTTGFYWTLTVMSTLGFGDIIFTTDLGRLFSILVLLSGMVFMLVLLPFTFIEFFYEPWMKSQAASRTPRHLPKSLRDHVILTHYDEVTSALIEKLNEYHYDYVLLIPDADEAINLSNQGLTVLVGDLDSPETYRNARIKDASLLVATASDPLNVNIASTALNLNPHLPIVATANDTASIDILELAGATAVIQLGEMMGQALARHIHGGDASSHTIATFDNLRIAQAHVDQTPLVGKALRDSGIREQTGVTVIGIWEEGSLQPVDPDMMIQARSVLLLAGNEEHLTSYNELFKSENIKPGRVIIIGGGRVGRATAKVLRARGIDYRIVEQLKERIRDPETYVLGTAAEREVLEEAGLWDASSVVITSHEDETNVYLTIYCRRLRPDIEIISRATHDRNVATMHRAGADFVMSYATMGTNTIFNLLRRSKVVMIEENMGLIQVPIPRSLVGQTIREAKIREKTGCSLVAIKNEETTTVNPDPDTALEEGSTVLFIGSSDAENRFMEMFT